MSKRLIMILTLAFVAGIAFAAYAEVQNVKVSGDLGISALSRDQFDLTRGVKGNTVDDSESLFISQARLRIDADLTDNVAATVRLINERMWGDTETTISSDIDLDLAYVSMKEFLYSPLSLTIGRQELRFGNGLVIGNANASTNISDVTNGVPTDLSLRKAFDGIKAVLNYDPLMIDVIYAKISETSGVGGTKVNKDTNLYGVNAAYNLGRKNAKVEGYALNKINSTADKGPGSDNIKTVGMLFSASPIENLFTSLEGAYQFGHSDSGAQHKKRACAIEFISNYALLKVKFTPSVGFTYAYLSGDKNSGDNRDKAWDSMYYDQAVSNIAGAILPFSDVSVYSLNGNAKLREDLKVSMIWAYYRLNQRLSAIQSNKRDSAGARYLSYAMNPDSKNLGYEIDLTGTYDYTEDVQLGLTFGYFNPNKAFAEANRRDATQLIGSMKVTF